MQIKNQSDRDFFSEMNHVSDRTAAVASTAYLEDKLRFAIQTYLKRDKDTSDRLFKPTGPLGALQNKADLAYLMRLIRSETRDDIKLAAEIRNMFAHWAEPVSFGHKEIRTRCERLGFHKRLFPGAPVELDPPPPWEKDFAKFRFISFIDMLCGHLIAMTEDQNHPKIL